MAKNNYGQTSHKDVDALNKEKLREDIATAGKTGVTALGAVTGAVVGGPVGAVIGGSIAYAGPGRAISETQKMGESGRKQRRANKQRNKSRKK